MLIRRVARPMLAAAFVSQGIDALRRPMNAADSARPTLEGLRKLPEPLGSLLPEDPETFARVTAAAQIGGGLLLATGRMPRLASAALATTVLPANLGAHMFWAEPDPVGKARKRHDFMVDLSLLGGLIIASADTAGKPSLSWRGRRAARRVSEAVSVGLAASAPAADGVAAKVGHGLREGAHRGQELVEAAGERSAPLVQAARKRGEAALEATREHGGKLAAEAKTEVRRLARH
ncbi:DoxX family protein [Mycolicibacterium sp.]|uniref:DoxX family protein n=1 Tax=Mycolicibacterium sp. TaxID=2320850 RepID=UPI0028AA2947|nr:DoxX family protein [Mycolicibacterium sp.]